MLGPILRGQKISLEPPEREDLSIIRLWFADMEITRYLASRFPLSQKSEEEWYDRSAASDNDIFWKIVVDGRAIGVTAIHAISWINRCGRTGLTIGEQAQWGKGYASEAVRLRTAFAFEEMNLERLECSSYVENLPMHRALEKSGYRKFGRARHVYFKNGEWHDEFLLEVLREEWLALKAPQG
jgi:RimJ/RimL family protein N-acetyltransferase